MKQNYQLNVNNQGFTLIELIVVIAIMVVMATLFIANYNGTRGARNLRIAQNKLVTDIRKAQSYILSSRDFSYNGTIFPAKFYFMKVTAGSSQYTLNGITNTYLPLTLETINLPQGITVSNVTVSGVCPVSCIGITHIAFGSPFGKGYIKNADDSCGSGGFNIAAQDPSCLLTLADRQAVITLQDTASQATKTVTVSGASGKVEAGP